MVGRSKNKNPPSPGEGGTTLVANNTRVCGDVFFKDQLYVAGVVEGDVSSEVGDDATLVVCASGVVRGEIRAPNVVIDGVVEGDVYATGKLELAAKGKVMGNVHYNLVEMHLGAVVNGQMVSLADAPAQAAEPGVQAGKGDQPAADANPPNSQGNSQGNSQMVPEAG